MKKFTKGCLMTALILFIVGIILCGVCGLLGGFRQLSEMDGANLPFGYFWKDVGREWRNGFLRSAGYDEDYSDTVRSGADSADWKPGGMEEKKEQLALTADTLGSIDIDVEKYNVLILQSEDEHVWFYADGDSHRPYYSIENNGMKSSLDIENDAEYHLGNWKNDPDGTVCLWLPSGCVLEECEVSMGAGFMESIFLKAKQVEVVVGAGRFEAEGFEGDEVTLLVGAGELLAGRVTAREANFEIGAGHLSIQELSASGRVDLSMNMGKSEITGTIAGDLDLECDMGETVMNLTGSEDDHSYEVECGMGEVRVGSRSHGGLAAHRSWNGGKDSLFDIDCNMGNVTISFDEQTK